MDMNFSIIFSHSEGIEATIKDSQLHPSVDSYFDYNITNVYATSPQGLAINLMGKVTYCPSDSINKYSLTELTTYQLEEEWVEVFDMFEDNLDIVVPVLRKMISQLELRSYEKFFKSYQEGKSGFNKISNSTLSGDEILQKIYSYRDRIL